VIYNIRAHACCKKYMFRVSYRSYRNYYKSIFPNMTDQISHSQNNHVTSHIQSGGSSGSTARPTLTPEDVRDTLLPILGFHFFCDVSLPQIHRLQNYIQKIRLPKDDDNANELFDSDIAHFTEIVEEKEENKEVSSPRIDSNEMPVSTLKTVQITQLLRAMVLGSWLTVSEYMYIERDVHRKVTGGVFLEQRLRATQGLFDVFLVEQGKEHPKTFKQLYDAHYVSLCAESSMTMDQWQTTLEGWRPVAEQVLEVYAKKTGKSSSSYAKKNIWQPFFFDGECQQYLQNLGFTSVIHTQDDFFKKLHDQDFMKKVDIIWDNPPYTTLKMKERVLRALEKCGKPFCILVPITVVQGKMITDVLKELDKIQLIIQRKVYARNGAHEKVTTCKGLCWLCYRMDLPHDLYII